MQSLSIESKEEQRIHEMSFHERRLWNLGYHSIAGIDEAGRGPIAGPVVAAACILTPQTKVPFLNDSKQLSPKKRDELFTVLTNDPKISFGIGIVSPERIDEINILQATFEAMELAVKNLSVAVDYLIVDGNLLPKIFLPKEAIVKGDTLSISIAAASILAKVTRDRLMIDAARSWPDYGFEKHKGYGTAAHLDAMKRLGLCPLHRKSFSKSLLSFE